MTVDNRLYRELSSGFKAERIRMAREKAEKQSVKSFNTFAKQQISSENKAEKIREKLAYARYKPTPKSRLKEAYQKGGVKEVGKEIGKIKREEIVKKFNKNITSKILGTTLKNRQIIKKSRATINIGSMFNKEPAEYRSNAFKEELMNNRRLFFK